MLQFRAVLHGIDRVGGMCAVAGQVSEDQIRAIAKWGGLKSIMNLRREHEGSFLHTEAELCEELGVEYHHVPMVPSSTTPDVMTDLMVKVRHVVVCCRCCAFVTPRTSPHPPFCLDVCSWTP